MAEESIPPELRRFILATLPSVPHLEALLLLRDRPEGLSNDALAARLYVAPANAARLVADLAQAGLATVDDAGAHYAPSRADVRATVDALAATYARNVVAVSHLIHSTTDRKAFQFADAFRLRKEGE
ncbi:MAG: helix-turn-helix domain-containing protein [Pseudomonadota bacterium]